MQVWGILTSTIIVCEVGIFQFVYTEYTEDEIYFWSASGSLNTVKNCSRISKDWDGRYVGDYQVSIVFDHQSRIFYP